MVSYGQQLPSVKLKPFFQEVKTEIQLPEGAAQNVLKLFSLQDEIIAVTPQVLYKHKQGKWKGKTGNTKYLSAEIDANGNLWLLTESFLQNEDGSLKIPLPDQVQGDSVLSFFWEGKILHTGTPNGMFSFKDETWEKVKETNGKRVNAIAQDREGILWVATNKGLLKRVPKEWQNLDKILMAIGTEERYFDLHIPKGTNDLIFSAPYSVGCIANDGNHWMWSGKHGLPYGPVTTIKSYNDILWFGTNKGVAKKDDKWHYYQGKRWIPHDKINDILPIDEHTTWIATPEGISQIQQVEMNLEEKAAHYEKIIAERHNRLGLINFSHLDVPGDLSSSRTENQDNDGLWTSTYLAAACFRFAVTQSEEAKKNAIRTFEAVERLETVTGISGLPARSFARSTDLVKQSRSPHPKKWRPSPNKDWQWLDDCSSDEMVGQIFSVALFYDLVADKEMKKRVKALVKRIMDHIIENDFQLIDYDGKPTRWGIWQPDSLNHSKNWAYEKGLYSLELLSFLKVAVYITGDQKYEETYRYLIENHHYAENTVEAKIYGPYENGFSDDILTYLPYYSLSSYARDDQYWPYFKKSIERTWRVCQPDRMPTWNVIASIFLQKDCDLEIAKEELELFPLDLIDWNMTNSHRWDLVENDLVGRGGQRQANNPIPTPESRIFRWNTNPYQFDSGVNGSREVSGTYFLLTYWMARYHHLFK